MTDHSTIETLVAGLGLTMTTEFVPFSKSRNAGEKYPSLNWIVKLSRNGREFLSTDYMAGSGHAPANKIKDRYDRSRAIAWECENGYPASVVTVSIFRKGPRIEPKLLDVLYSLISDASALDHASFDEWANEFGYDTDSRKAESIYRACIDIALKLRTALGDNSVNQLRDAFQNY